MNRLNKLAVTGKLTKDEQEVLAKNLTEDLSVWIQHWLGYTNPLGINPKTDIYIIILERLAKGIEV